MRRSAPLGGVRGGKPAPAAFLPIKKQHILRIDGYGAFAPKTFFGGTVMKQTIRFFLGAFILSAVSALPLAAQDFGFIIVNGTGGTITDIEIQPSRKLYGTDKDDIITYQSLVIHDQQEMFISLHNRLRGFEEFDISLKYGGKNAKTGDAVVITGSGNRFVAHPAGKSPTVPFVSAGAAAAAAGLGTAAAIGVGVGVVAPTAVSFSAVAAGVIAPTIFFPPALIIVGTAAGVGAGAFFAVNLFVPHTLVMARDD